ncbi:MAG TPA: lysophospholipid transporter LplT [Thiobacillaceae bacterium]|nr:lysophospholipid transporter LplT [Thiobacillaceae bacterium]HNF88965.1 lysophospholipid transporter LplT [Thiobacillaceae bacterium]HNH90607.1 lysophospholipid transporter LplT [Thiobacillaceae bacterium]
MTRGFYIILAAQFFSALADNALLFAAIALLKELSAPAWHTPLLQEFFVISYILLAPFVGPFADSMPKGRVMFISNGVKLMGCLAMLLGMPPLYAYAIVGLGAAAYSPAKYGILTEFLPVAQLVKANSWMEGATVAAIVLGAIVGGLLISPKHIGIMLSNYGLIQWLSVPQFAILNIILLYVLAAVFNLFIPTLPLDHKVPKKNPLFLLYDFWHSFKLLWKDPLGQVSLAVTTLFWGVGATLRLVVLAWAAFNLNFDLAHATQLTAMVAVGIAVGAAVAGKWVRLEQSVKVLPSGIVLGLTVISMILVTDWRLALVLMFIIGALSGYFVVPLNALLQHRGHLLMGAGHSIAIQNFNENIGILIMLGAYTFMVGHDVHIHWVIVSFGLFISLAMTLIWRRHRDDEVH